MLPAEEGGAGQAVACGLKNREILLRKWDFFRNDFLGFRGVQSPEEQTAGFSPLAVVYCLFMGSNFRL